MTQSQVLVESCFARFIFQQDALSLTESCLALPGWWFFSQNGDLPGLAGWVGAVVFVPALALGVFSSSSRVFVGKTDSLVVDFQ